MWDSTPADPQTCWGALDGYGNWLVGLYGINSHSEAIVQLGEFIRDAMNDRGMYRVWCSGGRLVMRYDEYLKDHPHG